MLATLIPLGKVFVIFAIMLAGLRRGVALTACVLGGSLLLALLFGMGPYDWLMAACHTLGQAALMSLAAVVGLILVLSDVLEQSGQGARLMDAAGRLIRSDRLRLIFFPALIGLLPMPGGALFSAPMVKSAAASLPVEPLRQAMLNYWFRHVWELTWPLYPGMILASGLTGIPLPRLILLTWPSLVLSLSLGWWFFLRPTVLPLPAPAAEAQGPRPWGEAARESIPLTVALGGALVLNQLMPGEWGFLLALTLAIVAAAVQNRWSPGRVLARVAHRRTASMVWLVLTIFVFKQVVEESGVIDEMGRAASGEAALFATAMLLPMLVALICGISMAFVGTTFPLLMGLISQLGLEAQKEAWVALGLLCGFTGVLASPLHACLLMTCDYFGVGLDRGFRAVLRPSLLMLAGAVLWFFALRAAL